MRFIYQDGAEEPHGERTRSPGPGAEVPRDVELLELPGGRGRARI